MARYQVILAYNGTGFSGSQRQARPRTIQGELEKALHKVGWTGRTVILAGRTDTGVHAEGQVAAFDMEWTYSAEQLLKALNTGLPSDLAVRSLQKASEEFHPRFDATSRRYRYRLFCDPVRNPLREAFAWRVWPRVVEVALKQSAGLFIGTHDFAAFGSPTTPKGSTKRTVMEADWRQRLDDEWQFEIRADAFLYRMVRRLVFVQVSVAQGKVSFEEVRNALTGQSRLPAGLAPAHGLTLVEVTYGSL
jgi:tRNA pseudouridine38-40 synthase